MTRKLKKEIWPYNHFFKHTEEDDVIGVDSDVIYEREKWLIQNFNDNIRDRVYIIESSRGMHYYFKREEDYNWFIWRWV